VRSGLSAGKGEEGAGKWRRREKAETEARRAPEERASEAYWQ
jgi:hypothetical protein